MVLMIAFGAVLQALDAWLVSGLYLATAVGADRGAAGGSVRAAPGVAGLGGRAVRADLGLDEAALPGENRCGLDGEDVVPAAGE